MIDNATYSWWSSPRVVGFAPGVVWCPSIARLGTHRFHRVNTAGAVTEVGTVKLTGYGQVDDHNGGAVWRRSDGDGLVVWGNHGTDPWVKVHRVRLDPATQTMNVVSTQTLTFPGSTTYAQLFEGAGGLVLLTRVGAKWLYMVSDDEGCTWSPPLTLIDASGFGQVYTWVKPGPFGNLDVVFYGHPFNSTFLRVVHTTVNLATGSCPAAAPGLSLWSGSGLSILPDDMDTVINPTDQWRVRLFDVGWDAGFPTPARVVAYGVWDGSEGVYAPCTYKMKRQTGSGWATSAWSHPAGAVFGYVPEAHYHGGVAVGSDGYLVSSAESGGVWTVRRWVPDGAGDWSPGTVLETSADPIVRPALSPNPVSGEDVLSLLRVHGYAGYESFDTDIVIHV
jgi:hypothetical protein